MGERSKEAPGDLSTIAGDWIMPQAGVWMPDPQRILVWLRISAQFVEQLSAAQALSLENEGSNRLRINAKRPKKSDKAGSMAGSTMEVLCMAQRIPTL